MDTGVSIVIAHYKTEDLVKLCLRSIRRWTRPPYEVIVVDNDSGDDPSLSYLRKVRWIRLLSNVPKDCTPSEAHKQAMQKGLEHSSMPLVLSLHSDSIPISPDWLDFLRGQMERDSLAAIGSYKLELKSPLQLFLKRVEAAFQHRPKEEYIRSHCALYRRDLLDKFGLGFNGPEAIGRDIHFRLIEEGYRVRLLEPRALMARLVHLNHATMVLHPELGARSKTVRQGRNRIRDFWNRREVREIFLDESLDE